MQDDTPSEQRFSYRPAALRSPVELRLSAERLTFRDGHSIALHQIEKAAFVSQRVGGSGDGLEMVRLDLRSGGRWRSIGFTGKRATPGTPDDAQQHRRAIVAVLRALDAAQPGATITLGAVGAANTWMLAIGIVSLALGLAGLGFAGTLPSSRLVQAAVPISLLVVLGVVVSFSYWPWRARVTVGAGALADVLSAPAAEHESDDPKSKARHKR